MNPILFTLGLLAAPALGEDDIGALLEGIPDIQTTEAESATEAAQPSAAGLDEDLGQISLPQYIEALQTHLLTAMPLPRGIIRKHGDKTVQLRLKITSSGKISGMTGVSLSGDRKVDKKVIEAVQASAPLPRPPIVHRADALRGLVIALPLARVAR